MRCHRPSCGHNLLATIITVVGEPVSTVRITKKTPQEVLYESGELAWVRSPLWLLIRMSLQRLAVSWLLVQIIHDRLALAASRIRTKTRRTIEV
jgi:hypothetical protein